MELPREPECLPSPDQKETEIVHCQQSRVARVGYDIFASREWMRRANERLIDMLPPTLDGGKIADVGAGTGVPSAQILDRFPHSRLTCIEPSDSMLSVLQNRFRDTSRVHIKKGHAGNLAEHLSELDAIVSFNMVHYLSDSQKQEFFKAAAAVCKPGASLALNTGFFQDALTAELKLFNATLATAIGERVLKLSPVPQDWKKGLKRKDPPSDRYLELLQDGGFEVLESRIERQRLTIASVREFFRTDEVASCLLPALPMEDAAKLLGDAVDEVTRGMLDNAVTDRAWFYVHARRR